MQVYSVMQACDMLGVERYRVQYALQSGKAGKVNRLAGRMILSADNLRLLAKHFDKPLTLGGDAVCLAQRGQGQQGQGGRDFLQTPMRMTVDPISRTFSRVTNILNPEGIEQ